MLDSFQNIQLLRNFPRLPIWMVKMFDEYDVMNVMKLNSRYKHANVSNPGDTCAKMNNKRTQERF